MPAPISRRVLPSMLTVSGTWLPSTSRAGDGVTHSETSSTAHVRSVRLMVCLPWVRRFPSTVGPSELLHEGHQRTDVIQAHRIVGADPDAAGAAMALEAHHPLLLGLGDERLVERFGGQPKNDVHGAAG